MDSITLNDEQQLYVLRYSDGYSSRGYKNVMELSNQIAKKLKRGELAFTKEDFGTLAGYEKYQSALNAWAQSPLSTGTFFNPGTDIKVARALERCRINELKVRLISGNPNTGEPWLDEYGVVGKVGRTTGMLKCPILVEEDEGGGLIIPSDCLLALIDWQTGKYLYRHPLYRAPELIVHQQKDKRLPWEVLHRNQVIARFKDIGKAGAYIAFMRGETVEPRIFR